MKKIISLIILSMIYFSINGLVYAQPKKCPEVTQLEDVSQKDKEEVINSLRTLIPQTYEVGDYPHVYKEWRVLSAIPFSEVGGNEEEENYLGMAKNFCGEKVTNKSWLVRLDFPQAKGASASQGQLFIAKDKEKGWFVWFRYH